MEGKKAGHLFAVPDPRPSNVVCLLLIILLISACSPGASPSSTGGSIDEIRPAAGDSTTSSADQIQDQSTGNDDAESEEKNESAADVNPCGLLSTPEVEAALGDSLSSAERSTVGIYNSCYFQAKSGGKFIILQLTHQNAIQFKEDNETSSEMLESELISVEDLGDEAVFYSGLLRVRVGETVIQFATWYTEEEETQALILTKDLALKALSRLPK
jgi:hypothetical protein